MKIIYNKNVLFVIRAFIALLFIITGAGKIADPQQFSMAILKYRIFDLFFANIIAIYIPWFELVVGVLLLFGSYIKENIIFIDLMLIFFNVLIITAIIRGLNIDCGCYGAAGAMQVGFTKLAENFGLIALSLVLLFAPKFNTKKNIDD